MVYESIRSIVVGSSRPLLVRSLRSLRSLRVVRLRRLSRVRSRVRVVHEIPRRGKASGVWLLLGILGVCLLSSLSLRWEDWVREGRGSGRIVSRVLGELFSVAQVEKETIAVVVLHVEPICILLLGFNSEKVCRQSDRVFPRVYNCVAFFSRVRWRLAESSMGCGDGGFDIVKKTGDD